MCKACHSRRTDLRAKEEDEEGDEIKRISLYQIGDIFGIMTDKFTILTDSEQAVLQTMTMQLNPKKALEYSKGVGIDMSERTYFRCKKKVESTKWQRLYHIAELFIDQHLERIDKLELSSR